MRTHCIADQPPALRHQARKLAFILPEEAAMAQKLDIAFWNYDRTRLLADGSVKIEARTQPSTALGLSQRSSKR